MHNANLVRTNIMLLLAALEPIRAKFGFGVRHRIWPNVGWFSVDVQNIICCHRLLLYCSYGSDKLQDSCIWGMHKYDVNLPTENQIVTRCEFQNVSIGGRSNRNHLVEEDFVVIAKVLYIVVFEVFILFPLRALCMCHGCVYRAEVM